MKYGFSVARPALAKLLNLPGKERWQMHDWFAAIAAHPFAEPDLLLTGENGRTVCVRIEGEWLIHYWVDHAARHVIVVELEETSLGES